MKLATLIQLNAVTMPKDEFVEEHKHLTKVLRQGTPEERRKEAKDQAQELQEIRSVGRISKITVGYVFHKGTDYRCSDCWKFVSPNSCAEMAASASVSPKGTCIYWSYGKPSGNLPCSGSYTPQQLGYTEDPNGTKCKRCEYADGQGNCAVVEGPIQGDACCANQTPK